MLWAADTNILVPLVQIGNPALPEAAECRQAIKNLRMSGQRISIFQQNAIEFWNVATRPATGNRPGLGLSTTQAERDLRYLEAQFGVWYDVPVIYDEWRRLVVTYGISGVQVHDARLAAAAHMHGITHLLTYNVADFARYSAFLTAVHPNAV